VTYSLQQAADAAGVNESTVFRTFKAGKVSATRNEHDQLIEPADSKAMATTRISPNSVKPPSAPPSGS
jgi:hypothetical protein